MKEAEILYHGSLTQGLNEEDILLDNLTNGLLPKKDYLSPFIGFPEKTTSLTPDLEYALYFALRGRQCEYPITYNKVRKKINRVVYGLTVRALREKELWLRLIRDPIKSVRETRLIIEGADEWMRKYGDVAMLLGSENRTGNPIQAPGVPIVYGAKPDSISICEDKYRLLCPEEVRTAQCISLSDLASVSLSKKHISETRDRLGRVSIGLEINEIPVLSAEDELKVAVQQLESENRVSYEDYHRLWMLRESGSLDQAVNQVRNAVSFLSTGHWGRSGAGILIYDRVKNEIFILERSKFSFAPGTLSIPGGAVDYEENPLVAAMAETKEELSTVPNGNITKKTSIIDPSGKFIYTTFLLEIDPQKRAVFTNALNVNRLEHKGTGEWVSLNELGKRNIHPGLLATLDSLALISGC